MPPLLLREDPERTGAFIQALADVHVLTAKEAKLSIKSPKLIKLRSIGKHKDFLRRKDIARFLEPSYSAIYQLIVLYEDVAGTVTTSKKVEQLASIVAEASTRGPQAAHRRE